MPQLQITRINEYTNRLRNVKLCLDGNEIGLIKNNETVNFTIPSGSHLLKAKIDWWSAIGSALMLQKKRTKNLNSVVSLNIIGSV